MFSDFILASVTTERNPSHFHKEEIIICPELGEMWFVRSGFGGVGAGTWVFPRAAATTVLRPDSSLAAPSSHSPAPS